MTWTNKTNYAMLDNRHGGSLNVVYADGHIGSLTARGSKATFTADSNPYKNDAPFNVKLAENPFWMPEI